MGFTYLILVEILENTRIRYCTVSLKDANRSNSYSYLNHCGRIYVDINGTKGPNVYGKDLFEFKIFKDGIN